MLLYLEQVELGSAQRTRSRTIGRRVAHDDTVHQYPVLPRPITIIHANDFDCGTVDPVKLTRR